MASGQPKDILIYDNPAIRAVTLGQGKILVGTKNGEVSLNNILHKVTMQILQVRKLYSFDIRVLEYLTRSK